MHPNLSSRVACWRDGMLSCYDNSITLLVFICVTPWLHPLRIYRRSIIMERPRLSLGQAMAAPADASQGLPIHRAHVCTGAAAIAVSGSTQKMMGSRVIEAPLGMHLVGRPARPKEHTASTPALQQSLLPDQHVS